MFYYYCFITSLFYLPFMLFVLLLLTAYTRKVVIQPKTSFIFEKEFKKGETSKFEFHETNKGTPHVTVTDNSGREILNVNTNYEIAYWGVEEDTTYIFKFVNNSSAVMKIYFRTPDVNKELVNALGPITDKDVLAEFDNALRMNIQNQRVYLKGLEEHEKLTIRTRRFISFLVIVEVICCGALIYYLHKKTLALFERKQQA